MDAWIDQARATQNKGTDTNLRVLPAARKLRRAVVLFDLSSIPESGCVGSATLELKLTAVQNTARTFAVHRVTQSWTESGVTWNRSDASTSWTAAGGDFAASASALVSTGTTNGATLQWDLTADVQAFQAGTAPNYGWLVKDANEGSGGEFRFASDEYNTVASRPQLAITFAPCP